MSEFDWNPGADGSHKDLSVEPDFAFTMRDSASEPAAPAPISPRAAARASRAVASDEEAPLTRRELRARETAELAQVEAAAVAAAAAGAAAAEPVAQLLAAMPAPTVLSQQAPAPHRPPVVAPAAATPVVAPASAPVAVEPPTPQHVDVYNSVDELFAANDFMTAKITAPKKPKLLRPVRTPRGMTRPRNAAPALPRARVAVAHRAPFKRRVLKKMMAFGAMIGAGLMMVATTVPANAFFPAQEATASLASAPTEVADVQSIRVLPATELTLARDNYTATSYREQQFLKYGNRTFLYRNNPVGAVQWPFRIAVPISDGYGYRLDPCSFCSPWHKGVDFTPGVGADIQVIADGVVTKVIPSHYGLGNHTIIDHVINGQHVQSVYGHMRDGTMLLTEGQEVKVGDIVGKVGNTGESTGPHLHFEIHIGGEPVDPFEWLKANATP